MTLAVSNIAWPPAEDDAAHALLRDHGVAALEIAPTRWWPDLSAVTAAEARAKADQLAAAGLPVRAFQALLFGRPELQVFADDGGRALLDHLLTVMQLAAWMGARALVFGSPKNRLRGALPPAEAFERSVRIFREAGEAAASMGVVLCLEPNPPAYGADFMTTAAEAAEVVRACDTPGIALNIDLGEMILNNTDVAAELPGLLPLAGHFHVSEPMLEPFDAGRREHLEAAAVLQRAPGAVSVVSVEMKGPAGGLPAVQAAVGRVRSVYRL